MVFLFIYFTHWLGIWETRHLRENIGLLRIQTCKKSQLGKHTVRFLKYSIGENIDVQAALSSNAYKCWPA